jgi:protein prenyltransferase alpha subunit repeat containing protein 1
MSRALDAETASGLHSDNPQKVYSDIATTLCPNPPSLLELEFLGKSHALPPGTSLLIDGNNIGIPKSKLVQAFIYARQLFFHHLRPCPGDKKNELLKATAVMLLMDPEHLTAANSRKRVIQTYQHGPKSEFEAVLKRELLFVDSYLTSRLHRHTKSPTLWAHRRWLLENFNGIGLIWDLEKDLKEVVLVAAERHPRNYYAWLYLRWLVQNADCGRKKLDKVWALPAVKNWCLRHPADTSGFSFLLFYLESFGRSGVAPENKLRIDASTSVYREVLGLAQSFKWTHESVWVFLRTLVASGVVGDQRIGFLGTINSIVAANPENLKVLSTLQAAADWHVKYERRLGP